MQRRDFISLFLLSPVAALADQGLLIDQPESTSGLLIDLPSKPLVIASVEKDLPELWYWSHPGCPPCAKFKKEYEEAKDSCGFIAIEKESTRPEWMPDSDPQFWWHIKEKIPTQKDVLNTRHQDGYPGWKSLLEKFKHSREPKKIKQAGGPAKSSPFAQPDQPDTRAVARNSLVFHNGHNCPSCGQTQYVIENGQGPNHTHRCGSCSTVWYHADQLQASQSNNRSFLFLRW